MMKNQINIAELLKDCPKGMELDCILFNNPVKYDGIDIDDTYPIKILTENDEYFYFTKEGYLYHELNSKCLIFPKGKTTWEGFVPPCEFKDGDVLVHTQNGRFIMSIYKSNENEKLINTHVIFWDREEGLSVGMQICCYTDNVRFATKEEKAKLFQAIKDNGYKWNDETKTLDKFTPDKFDINTLKPFDKVLVRDNNTQFWTCDWFSFHDTKQVYPFACVGHYVSQCIPYEGNQHLLGTTNDCDEFYKNW